MSDKITVEIELELSTLDYFVQVAKKYGTTAEDVIQARLSRQAFEASMSSVSNLPCSESISRKGLEDAVYDYLKYSKKVAMKSHLIGILDELGGYLPYPQGYSYGDTVTLLPDLYGMKGATGMVTGRQLKEGEVRVHFIEEGIELSVPTSGLRRVIL